MSENIIITVDLENADFSELEKEYENFITAANKWFEDEN